MSITSKFHSKSLASCLGNSYLASLLFNLWKKICSWLQAPSVHWCLASSWANGYQRTASLTHPSGLRGNRCPSLNCWDHSVFWMTSGLNMWAKVGVGGEKKINMGWVTEKGKDSRREYQLMGQSQLSLAISPNISMILWFFFAWRWWHCL